MANLIWTETRFQFVNYTKSQQEKVKELGFHYDYKGYCYWTGLIHLAKQVSLLPDVTCDAKCIERFKKEENQIALSRAVDCNIDIPVPEGLKYLGYQKAGIYYALGRADTLIADVMRLGKTVQSIGVINADPSINNILIICPAFLKLNWARELVRWSVRKLTGSFASTTTVKGKTSYTLQNTNIVIINYEIVKNFRKAIDERQWDLLICDECFPYETPVLTEQGYIPIGEIVEKKLLTRALSYNIITKEEEWKPIIGFSKKKPSYPLVKVVHEHGEFICTANHSIWTTEGYKQAIFLKGGDYLSFLPEGVCSLQIRQEKVLQQELLGKIHQYSTTHSGSNLEKIQQAPNCNNVRMVQEGEILPKIKEYSQEILLKEMFSSMEKFTTGSKRALYKDLFSERNEEFTKVAGSSFKENEREQSIQESGNCREMGFKKERKILVRFEGRKWNPNQTTVIDAEDDKISIGTSDKNNGGEGTIQISPNSLLSGSSGLNLQDSHRNRWKYTSTEEAEVDRPQKNRSIKPSRVVSIEILEQGSRSKPSRSSRENQYVYCLEVEDNHNFFAENILVSNSHYLKNPESMRTKATLGGEFYGKANSMPIEAKRRIFLTGTPILNRPVELWPIVRVCDPEGLGINYWAFVKKFCNATEELYGWNLNGASNLEELQTRLRSSFMIRRTKEEVLPELPPIRHQIIPIPAEAKDKKTIAAEKEFYEKNLAAFEAAAVQAEIYQAEGSQESYKSAANELKSIKKVMFFQMSKLRHDTAVLKIPYVIEYLENCLLSQDKVVCFAHHHDVIQAIANHFGTKSVMHYGKLSQEAKQASVDRFATDKTCTLFVGGISSAAGYSLAVASLVVMAELSWVPGEMDQAEKRLDAVDQMNSILVQHIVFDDSLDVRQAQRVIEKQEVIKAALD